MSSALWWVRRDFRLHDNPPLRAARSSADVVYAVFCLAELDSLNERQRAFAIGCLQQLRADLEKRDATLTLAAGEPGDALAFVARRLGAATVHCARAYNASERAVEAEAARRLARDSIALALGRGDLAHEPEDIAARKLAHPPGYRIFGPFFDAWRAVAIVPAEPESAPNGRDEEPGALPAAPNVPTPKPGEDAATALLTRFVTGRVQNYRFLGAYPAGDGTSRLAPYLRFGCISARTVIETVSQRMALQRTLEQERVSMASFIKALARREFFLHLAFFAPEMHAGALRETMRGFTWREDEAGYAAWLAGRTGYPIVDAALRQLRAEGYVHQRAAACAASFLCFDLGLDWRRGRDVWMHELLASDEALCDGNWQWIAGVGSDQIAYPRIYNPTKQARIIDPQGVYVRRWVRELTKLPTRAALEPWELSRQQQTELGFYTPEQYPPPLVDHDAAARETLARVVEHRRAG